MVHGQQELATATDGERFDRGDPRFFDGVVFDFVRPELGAT